MTSNSAFRRVVRSTFSFWPTRLSPRRASHHIFKRHIYCRARGLTRTVAAKRFQPFQHDSQQTLTVFVVFRLRRLLRSLSQHSIHHLAFYVCALCASFADFCFLRNLFVRVSALLSRMRCTFELFSRTACAMLWEKLSSLFELPVWKTKCHFLSARNRREHYLLSTFSTALFHANCHLICLSSCLLNHRDE